jgi:hypothetical protein
LNESLSKNWKQFASANYFDESGLFLATVYSLPLILNCVLALVSCRHLYLCQSLPASSHCIALGACAESNMHYASHSQEGTAGKAGQNQKLQEDKLTF